MTDTSLDFSMSCTRIIPIKSFLISGDMTPTRFLTNSKLRMRSSVALAGFVSVVDGFTCSLNIFCRAFMKEVINLVVQEGGKEDSLSWS